MYQVPSPLAIPNRTMYSTSQLGEEVNYAHMSHVKSCLWGLIKSIHLDHILVNLSWCVLREYVSFSIVYIWCTMSIQSSIKGAWGFSHIFHFNTYVRHMTANLKVSHLQNQFSSLSTSTGHFYRAREVSWRKNKLIPVHHLVIHALT